MSADTCMNLACCQTFMQSPFLSWSLRTSQNFNAIRGLSEQSLYVARVLFSKYLRRGHESCLVSTIHGRHHANHGNDRLSAAYVTLKQAIHRRLGLHVIEDLGDHMALCAR